MTEKELRGLSRADLLELLIMESKKNQELQMQLDEANAKLRSKEITINNAGSIAEAALQLNGIFDAAQAASEQYLQNIMSLSQRQEEVCAEMERQTRQQCDEMVAQAEQASKAYWDEVSQKLDAFYKEHAGLKQLLATMQ
jgi:hypothetical protein